MFVAYVHMLGNLNGNRVSITQIKMQCGYTTPQYNAYLYEEI